MPGLDPLIHAPARLRAMTTLSAVSEVEFATLMWFDDLGSIEAFVGNDVGVSHVPAAARAVLARFDERVVHYETLDRRPQPR